ncbi:Emsy N Terminus (ENT) domain-containing protein [Euphorbia peplus]|nr:Emsy N Terminus (ENT) domain-containing protein [Euphorbia peplus]
MDFYNFKNEASSGSHGLAIEQEMMNTGASRMPFMKDSRERGIKIQIQRIEKEAYYFVLRAFNTQSDLISWEKVGLITALRRELNISDSEHVQILGLINSDESVKRIREWRKNAHQPPPTNMQAPVRDILPNKTTPALPRPPKSQNYLSHDKAMTTSLAPEHFRKDQHCYEVATHSTVDSMKIANHNFPTIFGGSSQSYLHVGCPSIHTDKFKNCSDPIQIRSTEKIIHEVKQIAFGRENPGPIQLQRAMSILGEQERDILQALDKITNVSDEIDSRNQLYHSQEQLYGSRRRMV